MADRAADAAAPAAPRLDRRRRALLRGLAALAAASGWVSPALAQRATAAPLDDAGFAALAQALAGFEYTDPALARRMLAALQDAVGAPALRRIATLAAVIPPAQLGSELATAGVAAAAERVVIALYTGVIDTPKGPVVLTYDQALVWQACAWTKPNAVCGGVTNYWADAPAGVKT